MQRADAVVVGLGAMGSAAAWQLARRGRRVVGLEQHTADHALGSSHGRSRIFRVAYEQDDYVALAVEALGLWRQLEDDAQTTILEQTGAIDHGSPAVLDRITAALRRHGLRHEMVDAAEARRRWAGIAFDGPAVYSPDGGRTDADAARSALQAAATRHGADLRFRARAARLDLDGRGVRVTTDGAEVAADVAVVTVNAWAHPLLDGLVDLPPLRVTQEQPAFFAPRDPDHRWPSFVRYRGDGTTAADFACYGLASPVEGGVKVGEHATGIPVDPAGPRPPVDAERLERLSGYVAAHLPGLDPRPLQATPCLYATTPTEDFVLDRVGPLVVGVGFSGHGFKFTPAIGRVLADLAEAAARPAARFRL